MGPMNEKLISKLEAFLERDDEWQRKALTMTTFLCAPSGRLLERIRQVAQDVNEGDTQLFLVMTMLVRESLMVTAEVVECGESL